MKVLLAIEDFIKKSKNLWPKIIKEKNKNQIEEKNIKAKKMVMNMIKNFKERKKLKKEESDVILINYIVHGIY